MPLGGKTVIVAILGLMMSAPGARAAQAESSLSHRLERMRRVIRERGNSFSVGYNPACEHSLGELCGLIEPPDWRERAVFRRLIPSADLPSAFDWRDYGIVPPVRDQASCGSCWAFGSVGPLEAAVKWKDGVEVDLAEQWLVSCNQSGWSCNGGWWAHDYHGGQDPLNGQDGGNGAVKETDFPYVASDVSCQGPYNHPYRITSWHYLGSGYSIPSTEEIKEAIYSHGPVSVAVRAGSYFQSYTGGGFDQNESGQVNHAVVLVGWDDNNGQGYWILRNSWGNDWGEDGYMRIRWGTSQVGYSANYIVYTAAASPVTISAPAPIFR